ncbi:YdcF family protein [Streptomyces globisporus]|uniref:YdcF family protein n=1 Tax=Streptomyces globisporus TaxID=1908 RepID=A0A927GML1_STRGL|nr:YdcF family protein [Streptomyces globisporus]
MISAQNWADAHMLWDFQQMRHVPRPCSVGIGLGSHDLGVADATVDLHRRGMFPLIVFTGAISRTTEGRMPKGEAEHYRERALELGVPESAILVEPNARNTGENIRFSQALLEEQGVDVSSILLVSKPYEERRAYATARKLWPAVDVISASTDMKLEEYVDSIGDARLVLDMLVGAQQRVVLYAKRGFTVAQDVPDVVVAAYGRLRDSGFTARLMPE